MDSVPADSESSLLERLGARLERHRLDRDLTQAALAREAGVSKRTVERLENGASVQLTNLVRVLRALDLVDGLDRLVPDTGPRPLDLLAREGKQRRRARSTSRSTPETEPWTWEDDA